MVTILRARHAALMRLARSPIGEPSARTDLITPHPRLIWVTGIIAQRQRTDICVTEAAA
jgi:hypothetical protein